MGPLATGKGRGSPAARHRPAVSCSSFSVLAHSTILAPNRAKVSAIARPIPRPEPVTRTHFPRRTSGSG